MEGYPGEFYEDDINSSDRSSTSSSNSNLSARPKGLSSEEALSRLVRDIRVTLDSEPKSSFKTILQRSLDPQNETSLFPISAIFVGIFQSGFLFIQFIFLVTNSSEQLKRQSREFFTNYNITDIEPSLEEEDESPNPAWLAFQAILLLLLVACNVCINYFEQYSAEREMRQRLDYISKRLDQIKSDAGAWLPTNYPHLHTPLSSSVVCQWTLRNGSLVNLPWALLVEGDVILIKPGQVAPGKCHSLEEPVVHIDSNQVLHVRSEDSGYDQDPKPRFCRPLSPQLFILDETPYLKLVRITLRRDQLKRPASVLWKYSHLFFTRILNHWLCPVAIVTVIGWNLVRHIQGFAFYEVSNLNMLILVHPVAVTLPLLSMTFPMCWMMANYFALAKLLCMFGSFRHVKITDDPFDDNVGNSDVETPARNLSCEKIKSYFFSALLGTGEFLSRTENIVHTFGSITALCCTDKKGILSWPNTSAEKIFLLKKKEEEVRGNTTDSGRSEESTPTETGNGCPPVPDTPPNSTQIVAEILTVTHDHTNPFNVEFDDPNWRQHLSHLKPLGLSILLNTCNIRTEEQYTNFYNHLTCESMKVGEQVSERRRHHEKSESLDVTQEQAEELASCIDVLPIVTRGCLCDLSRKIGLGAESTAAKFKLTNQIQTFRHVQTDLHDKFARHLSLANLKFPFPHMVSVMVDEGRTHAGHLISQGTADIILDACADLWTGSDLEQLTEDLRKKILDFYHRSCLSAYCTAFSYRPLTFTFPRNNCLKDYLQLPTHNLKFYSQHSSEDTNVMDADILGGGDVSQWKLRHKEKVQTAMACLELECNQTFLGMVQLEYQARVDMVQLIDLLEKACIRFVHFSKENELRSRVFSEKMGLESGWNCHISLRNRSDKHGNRPSVTSVKKTKRKKRNVKRDRIGVRSKLGASIPTDFERQKGIFDYHKWHEINRKDSVAVFKSKFNLERTNVQLKQSSSPYQDYSPGYRRGSNTSREASVVSDSDPFEYDMSNRAQLPEGIENIRPHLETMDNVPLLVSLFTDCTPDTTTEMVVIMQEYGEVVCVMGSAAQFQNVPVFLQADASLAIEPLYPQLCQTIPVFVPTSPSHGSRLESTNVSVSPTWPSPVAVSQLLNSLASSLSFRVEDEISLFHLILESRHSTRSLLNAIQFWTCSSISISFLQLVAILVTFPLFLTIGQTLWLTLVVLPILSMSLLGNSVDPEIMNVSTGKNIFSDITSKEVVIHVIWCYGLRFLPAVSLLSLAHLLTVRNAFCPELDSNRTLSDCTDLETRLISSQTLASNAHLNLIWTEIFLLGIGFSFLFRGHQIWQRNPFKKNTCFMLAIALVLILQLVYSSLIAWLESDFFVLPPLHVWLIWVLGLPTVMALNEVVKRQEIKVEVRYQKRQRLEFQTKLGINSPF